MAGQLEHAVRAAAVPPFHAMAMSRAASELEASGRQVCHLEVRQPSTPSPEPARCAAIAALERGEGLGYTNAAGLMSKRRRIAQHYREWYDTAAGLADVAVADGALYVYADVSSLIEHSSIGSSMRLCERWLDELGVACTPGLDFDLARGQHTVRFSYAGATADLAVACAQIAAWAP